MPLCETGGYSSGSSQWVLAQGIPYFRALWSYATADFNSAVSRKKGLQVRIAARNVFCCLDPFRSATAVKEQAIGDHQRVTRIMEF